MNRKIRQVGVIGSMADLSYSQSAEKFAESLGKEIAKQKWTLVFGAEKDSDSLPTRAARAAVQAGGLTVGITYDKGTDIYTREAASIVVATGLARGGGREMVQALSCDCLIAIAGGSGTLNEITVAYQANIPVVVIEGFGGWSDRLKGTYLDERKRYAFASAKTPTDAINKLKSMYNEDNYELINPTL